MLVARPVGGHGRGRGWEGWEVVAERGRGGERAVSVSATAVCASERERETVRVVFSFFFASLLFSRPRVNSCFCASHIAHAPDHTHNRPCSPAPRACCGGPCRQVRVRERGGMGVPRRSVCVSLCCVRRADLSWRRLLPPECQAGDCVSGCHARVNVYQSAGNERGKNARAKKKANTPDLIHHHAHPTTPPHRTPPPPAAHALAPPRLAPPRHDQPRGSSVAVSVAAGCHGHHRCCRAGRGWRAQAQDVER